MNDNINKSKIIKTDGWGNLFSGMGTKADKRKSTVHSFSGIILDKELESIYNDDGLGAKIIDSVADDMVKKGWRFDFGSEIEDKEQSKPYDEIFKKMKLTEKLNEAVKWARLYGGAVAIIGAYDGERLDTPLDPKRIKKLESLKIIPRPNIMDGCITFQTDPKLPRFGEPLFYDVQFKIGEQYEIQKVHHSRVIEFHGVKAPDSITSFIENRYRYWGLPILQRVRDLLASIGSNFNAISHLMDEYSVGKYKLSDLADILSIPDGDTSVQNRIESMDLMKSVYHSIYLDTADDYVRENVNFTGIPDVLYQYFMMISSAVSIPMTRLFGTSPSGLNATGDSDTYAYYDMIEAQQNLKLRPALERLVEIVSEWQNLPKPEIEFIPLEQMTEKEQAELEQMKANTEALKAQTYRTYYDLGILEPYQIEKLEFGDSLKEIEEPATLPEVGE